MRPTEKTPGGLVSAYWKTERAKKHLEELADALLQQYLKPRQSSHAEENGRIVHRLEMTEPHAWIFLIVGDFLNCMRSALDHVVWRLVILNGGQPTRQTQFPILGEDTAKSKKTFLRQTDGLPQAAVDIIESLQPYKYVGQAPVERHPLYCLAELNNIDKHRRIAIYPTAASTGAGTPPDTEELVDGVRVFTFSLDASVQNPQFKLAIMFGSEEDNILVSQNGLDQIHDYVYNRVLVPLSHLDP